MAKGITVPVTQTGLEQSIQGAAKKVGSISIPIDVDAKSFKNLSQPLGRITGLATEFEKSIAASNARVIAFGASVGIINGVQNALASLVTTTIEVQKNLTSIGVIFGKTNEELGSFSKGLFAVARETAQSFQTASEAALEFSRQGLSTEETLKRTKDALTLTRFTSLSAADAVDVLTAAVNSFSSSGVTTSEILNKLVAVDTRFAVSSEDLAKGLSRAGSIAQEVGVSLDQLNGIITVVQEKTARGGAVIGNAFKTIFTRIRSNETIKALQEIGIFSRDASGNLRPVVDILTQLAGKLNGLSEIQKIEVLEAVASKYNINSLNALLDDLGSSTSKFQEISGISAKANNEAYARQVELNKTLDATIKQTVVSVSELANSIGEIGVTANLQSLLEFFNDVISGINDFINSESIGGDIAKSLISGISGVLFKIGLPILGAIFIKLTKDIAQFGVESLKTILGVNQQVKERQALEQAVVNTLIRDRDVMAAILALSGDRAKQEEYLLNLYNRQIAALQQVQSIAGAVAPGLVQAGLSATSGSVQRKAGRAAEGYLPAQEAADVKRGVGGADKNAKVVKIPNFSFGGGKKGTMYANTSEYVVPNFNGGDGTAIFNKDMVRKYGMPENAKKINAATGYIPNFAEEEPKQYSAAKAKELETKKNQIINNRVASSFGRAAMLVQNQDQARSVQGDTGFGVKPKANVAKFGRVRFPVYGLSQSGLDAAKLGIMPKIEEPLREAAFNIGVGASSELSGRPVNLDEYKKSFKKSLGSAGSFTGTVGGIFEAASRVAFDFQSSDTNTLDVPVVPDEMRIAFGITGGEKSADIKGSVSDGVLRKFADQVIDNNLVYEVFQDKKGATAARGYIPNFAEETPKYSTAKAKELAKKEQRRASFNNRVASSFGIAALLVKSEAEQKEVELEAARGKMPKIDANYERFSTVKFPVYGLKQSGLDQAKLGFIPQIEEPLRQAAFNVGLAASSEISGRQVSPEEYKTSFKKSLGGAGAFGGTIGSIFESAARTAFKFENSPDNTLDVPVVSDSVRTAFGITGGERSADLKGSVSDGVLRRFADQVITNNLIRDETPNVKQAIASKGYIPNFVKNKKTISALDRAAMLVPTQEEAKKVNEGASPEKPENREKVDFVKFRAYGISQQGAEKLKVKSVPDVSSIVEEAVSLAGAIATNEFVPLTKKGVDPEQFKKRFKNTRGGPGAMAAISGAVFETAVQTAVNPRYNEKAGNQDVTFDVPSLNRNIRDLFGITTNEKSADYKISAGGKGRFADQVIKNYPDLLKGKAAKGYIPNFAEQDYSWQQTIGEGENKRRVEMYDWDGTIIETIKGDPKTYVKELENAKLLPLGRELAASKIPFDLVTGRPIEFKTKPKEGQQQEVIPFRDPIKQAAKRLGLNVRKVLSLGSMFESRRVMGEKGKERKLYGDERRALLAQKTNRSIVSGKEDNLTALGKYGIDATKINAGSVGFIPNFAEETEKSKTKPRQILAEGGAFYTLYDAENFLAASTVSLQPGSQAKGLGDLKERIFKSVQAAYGPNAGVGISRLVGRREAFTSALLLNPNLADNFIALQIATTDGKKQPTAYTPEGLAIFNNPTPYDLPDKITERPAIRAVTGENYKLKVKPKSLKAAFGYIPSFADPLKEAVDREISAGVKPSQVRVTQDDRLMTSRNPEGIAVINTRDEPNGKVPSNRVNEKNGRKAAVAMAAKGFIPNFAGEGQKKLEISSLDLGLSKTDLEAFRAALAEATTKFSETNKTVEEINKASADLKSKIIEIANQYKIGADKQEAITQKADELIEARKNIATKTAGGASASAGVGITSAPKGRETFSIEKIAPSISKSNEKFTQLSNKLNYLANDYTVLAASVESLDQQTDVFKTEVAKVAEEFKSLGLSTDQLDKQTQEIIAARKTQLGVGETGAKETGAKETGSKPDAAPSGKKEKVKSDANAQKQFDAGKFLLMQSAIVGATSALQVFTEEGSKASMGIEAVSGVFSAAATGVSLASAGMGPFGIAIGVIATGLTSLGPVISKFIDSIKTEEERLIESLAKLGEEARKTGQAVTPKKLLAAFEATEKETKGKKKTESLTEEIKKQLAARRSGSGALAESQEQIDSLAAVLQAANITTQKQIADFLDKGATGGGSFVKERNKTFGEMFVSSLARIESPPPIALSFKSNKEILEEVASGKPMQRVDDPGSVLAPVRSVNINDAIEKGRLKALEEAQKIENSIVAERTRAELEASEALRGTVKFENDQILKKLSIQQSIFDLEKSITKEYFDRNLYLDGALTILEQQKDFITEAAYLEQKLAIDKAKIEENSNKEREKAAINLKKEFSGFEGGLGNIFGSLNIDQLKQIAGQLGTKQFEEESKAGVAGKGAIDKIKEFAEKSGIDISAIDNLNNLSKEQREIILKAVQDYANALDGIGQSQEEASAALVQAFNLTQTATQKLESEINALAERLNGGAKYEEKLNQFRLNLTKTFGELREKNKLELDAADELIAAKVFTAKENLDQARAMREATGIENRAEADAYELQLQTEERIDLLKREAINSDLRIKTGRDLLTAETEKIEAENEAYKGLNMTEIVNEQERNARAKLIESERNATIQNEVAIKMVRENFDADKSALDRKIALAKVVNEQILQSDYDTLVSKELTLEKQNLIVAQRKAIAEFNNLGGAIENFKTSFSTDQTRQITATIKEGTAFRELGLGAGTLEKQAVASVYTQRVNAAGGIGKVSEAEKYEIISGRNNSVRQNLEVQRGVLLDQAQTFQDIIGKQTPQLFADGMAQAMEAALSQTDDLGSALRGVATGFLKSLQGAFLQSASKQIVASVLPNALPFSQGGIVKGYATGGLVTGGSGYKDDVPAMLSEGEYVIRKSSVQKYGKDNLTKLNSGKMPTMADGGFFIPGFRGQESISGIENLKKFSEQTTTSGATDVMKGSASSAFINLEDQSMKLSRFALLGDDTINQEIRDAQQTALDVIEKRRQYDLQKQEEKKQFKKQLVTTILSAAVSYGTSAFLGGAAGLAGGAAKAGASGAASGLGLLDQTAGKTEFLKGVSAFAMPNIPKGAYGGMIPRYAAGGGTKDDVPALLMGGEYVMSNQATKKYGKQFFDSINQGRAPRFAAGGEVGGGEMLGEKFDNLSSKLETRGAPEVNITVNVTSSGASETKSQGESNQGGIDYKKMSERIKAVVIETINEEKRLGGSLRPRG